MKGFNPFTFPTFSFSGKREYYKYHRSEFDQTFRKPLKDLLDTHYYQGIHAELRLSPQADMFCSAIIEQPTPSQALNGGVGTVILSHKKDKHECSGELTTRTDGAVKLFGEVALKGTLKDYTDHLSLYGKFVANNKDSWADPKNLLAGISFKYSNSTSTSKAYSFGSRLHYDIGKQLIGGESVAQSGSGRVGLQFTFSPQSTRLEDIDIVFSLSEKQDLSKIAYNSSWQKPTQYDLSLRISEFGKKIQASYLHKMKFRYTESYLYDVILGGEFTHDERSSSNRDYMTVGGQWQIDNYALKAKADTKGDFSAVVGTKVGSFPVCTISVGASGNIQSPGSLALGWGFVLED